MGVRVEFWLGAADGIKGHFLSSPLEEFFLWSRSLQEEDPEALRPGVLELIQRVIREGESALNARSSHEAETIDRMIDLFHGYFCDCIRPDLIHEADDSALFVSRYEKHRSLIARRCSEFALSCWDYLLNGRGIGRQDGVHPYTSKDDIFRVGYWRYEECEKLLKKLESEFNSGLTPFLFSRDFSGIQVAIRALKNAVSHKTGLILTVA